MKYILNPILPGSYPDPSILRTDDDFYIVTSSFSYFPGIPVFHSKDLIHWNQIGHVLDRPEQLPLNAEQMARGIWAPSLSYHDGIYYVITTNIDHGGNFIVTAKNPAGPWSDPYPVEFIQGAGIDPALFWDNEKLYYLSTGGFGTEQSIWMAEMDPETFKVKGQRKPLWGGALRGCNGVEGPHLYKKDGWYYLLVAEGGTELYHSVCVARSRDVWGPYEGYKGNPILTHRNLGMECQIMSVGHGDLVELKDGSWYMTILASRPYGGFHKNMGRETFLVPVIWENGWPVVSPDTGKTEWSYLAPDLPEYDVEITPERDNFTGNHLAYCWNFLGTPSKDTYRLIDGKVQLRLDSFTFEKKNFDGLFEHLNPIVRASSFLGRRQQHQKFIASTEMEFIAEKTQTAGLMLLQNDFQSLKLEVAKTETGHVIRVVKGYASLESSLVYKENKQGYWKETLGEVLWQEARVILTVRVNGQKCDFYAGNSGGKSIVIAQNIDCSFLGIETAGGFVGTYVGMFASGNGIDYNNYASFNWFLYKEIR